MTSSIGQIERVPLRDVWPHEARDFTTWLRENLETLNEQLDLTLVSAESEQPAGQFLVDILGEDESGIPIIIENQLEKSDHDHLGKLITYMVMLDARAAVWIVADPRPEHISAISWLNEATSAHFYLVKLEAIQIGGSDPAPLLTLIVGPSGEAREAGKAKKDLAERHLIRREFWSQLLSRANEKTSLHSSSSPGIANWISASAGKPGFLYSYIIRQHDAQVELYIDLGKDSDEKNKRIFDSLAADKNEIENAFGDSLDWQRLDHRRASRVRKVISSGGYQDEEAWPKIQDEMVDKMIRLSEALNQRIERLENTASA